MKNALRLAAQACTDTLMEIVDEVEVCAQNDVATALTLVTLNVDPESRLTRPLISRIHVSIRASAHEEEYGRVGRILYMSRHRQAVKAVEEMLVEIEKNLIDGDFAPTVADLLDIFPIENDDDTETVVDLTDPGSIQ